MRFIDKKKESYNRKKVAKQALLSTIINQIDLEEPKQSANKTPNYFQT